MAAAPQRAAHGTARPRRRAARSREKDSSGIRLLRHPASARPLMLRVGGPREAGSYYGDQGLI
jgi:hypothetical protein